jgi:hypothetical protein
MHERARQRRRHERLVATSVLTALVVLQGCATHVVSSNERSVIVESQWMNIAKAQKLADEECAKHSRIALLTIKADPYERNYVFYCVEEGAAP